VRVVGILINKFFIEAVPVFPIGNDSDRIGTDSF